MPDPPSGTETNWGLIGFGFLATFLLGMCVSNFSSTDTTSNSSATDATELIASPDDQLPVPEANAAAVRRASVHAGRVMGALGSEGAARYSELCYEALRREFSDERRDRCYAFDLFVAKLLEQDGGYVPSRFYLSAIRSRWVMSGSNSDSFNSDADSLRAAVEALVASSPVQSEAPPRRKPVVEEPDWEPPAQDIYGGEVVGSGTTGDPAFTE